MTEKTPEAWATWVKLGAPGIATTLQQAVAEGTLSLEDAGALLATAPLLAQLPADALADLVSRPTEPQPWRATAA
jgi:hypothetical protein